MCIHSRKYKRCNPPSHEACTTASSDRRTRARETEKEKTGHIGDQREDREGERKDKTLKERRTYKRRT